jgi:hypothetical protein
LHQALSLACSTLFQTVDTSLLTLTSTLATPFLLVLAALLPALLILFTLALDGCAELSETC